MDFEIPQDIVELLATLDDFIEQVIKPLEQRDDNIRFFDHRREDVIPWITNKLNPTGGVICAISTTMTMNIPNQRRSIPACSTMG